MGLSVGTVIRGGAFWRKHEIGKYLIRRFLPKLAAKREPIWAQRAARKAPRPHQPDEAAGEFLSPTDEVTSMIPNNTMRKTGVGVMGLAPMLAFGLSFVGIGDSCSAEAVEMGCRTAGEIAGTILGGVGAIIYVIGSIRADRRAK